MTTTHPPAGAQQGAPNTSASTSTGAPTPSANPGNQPLTLEQLQAAITAAITPLATELSALKNASAAAQRVAGKGADGGQPTGGSDGANQPGAVDLSKLPDNVRAAYEGTQRELKSLREREEARTKSEVKAKATTALDAAIDAGKYANAPILKGLISPFVRLNDAGQPVHDDGQRVRPLEEVVREIGAQDVFRSANAGHGAGANAGAAGAAGGAGSGVRRVSSAEIDRMTPAQFKEFEAQLGSGAATLAD